MTSLTSLSLRAWKDPRQVRVTIRGLSPYIQHRLLPEEMVVSTPPPRSLVLYVPALRLASRRVIRASNGRPGVPYLHVFAALREAGCSLKNGPAWITTTTVSGKPGECRLPCYFRFADKCFPLLDPADLERAAAWRIIGLPYHGSIVTGLRDPYPMFERWQVSLRCRYDAHQVDDGTLRVLFQRAGELGVGYGRGRRDYPAQYGTFAVVGWNPNSRESRRADGAEDADGDGRPAKKAAKPVKA